MLSNQIYGPWELGPWRSLPALASCSAAILLVLMGLLGVSQQASADDGEFVNISTRALVGTGDEVMIGGFIISEGARQVLVQAVGPELAKAGISNALADPVLTVTASDGTELMANDNWEDSQGQLVTDLWGGSPNLTAGSLSSAAVLTLEPGNYTAKVEGKDGTAGVAIVEVYRIDAPDADGKFVNISTRALVGTGDEVMIGGFIIKGGARQVLVQAVGPELAKAGISNALADPVLTVTASDGTELMVNDNWEDSQGQLVTDLWGGSPNLTVGSFSSAAVLTLEPGNYTAKVEGKDGTAGVAIVEVYRIESPDEEDPDFEAFSGLRIGDDGGVTLKVGGISLGAGNTGCISGGATLNGLLYDYHWTAWQHNTGSGWTEVTDSRQTGELCGYDLTSAPAGKYRLVGDMTLAGVRGLYMSENEVTVEEGAGHAPEDQAAFNTLVVGKQFGPYANNTLVFLSPGRIREISDGTSFEGNYEYENTGANTGTLTYTYDATGNNPAVEKTVIEITFTSEGAGTFVSTYTETGSSPKMVRGPFELTEAGEVDRFPNFRSGTSPDNQNYAVGTAIDILTLPEAGDGDGTLTYSLSPEVPGLTFDPSARQLTGTPTSAGTYAMTYTVTDEDGDTDTLSFTVTVEESDDGDDLTGMDFDLDSANRFPEDITFANGKFYVLDRSDDKVYAYNASGQRDATFEFDLDSVNDRPVGITFASGKFYVLDGLDDKVYAYNASGQRDVASEFDLDPDNGNPDGIAFANDRFYVLDGLDDKVYAYNASGQREAASEFDLDPGNRNPEGITFANDRLYVPDGFNDEVYAYNASGQRDSLSEFDLDPDNDRLEGITFANDKFYVLDELDDKVYVYNASGQRDVASEFDLDPDNGNPEDITFANDKFYVLDGFDDKVYAYNASGQRDAASEFDLDPDNDRPVGITFSKDRFHVADSGNLDWVYAYQTSGQRDTASDFHLDSAITSPSGITFGNGKFYVLDSSFPDRVYVVSSTQKSPELVVRSMEVSDDPESSSFSGFGISVITGGSLRARATVLNRGTSASSATTLRFYRSDEGNISTSDLEVGTATVEALSAAGTFDASIDLTAPSTAGTYYYGACIESVSGESDTENNCSSGVRVTVREPAPDLVVESVSVSDDTPESGGSFMLSITVRNQGTATSTATTLRAYRSDERTLSTSNTEVGMVSIDALASDDTVVETITLPAPSTEGTYYFGACVDSVSGESNTSNNCSNTVAVFGGGPFPAYDLEITSVSLDWPAFAILGQSSISMTVEVTNQGPNASQPAKLRFSGGTLSYLDIPVLQSGESTTSEDHTVGKARLGTTTYRACIVEAPGEDNADNNCRSRSVTYTLSSPPDEKIGTAE